MEKSNRGRTASTQAVECRDSHGRFAKGNVPKTTFKDHPENRYDITKDGTMNPQYSPRIQLRRLWSLPVDEFKKKLMTIDSDKKMLYGEHLAILQANRARKSSRDFEITMNQAEGAPLQTIDMDVREETKSPYDDLTVEELRKLIGEDHEPKAVKRPKRRRKTDDGNETSAGA